MGNEPFDRRTAAKLIRFTPLELACITECAHACGQTPARFIRERALGAMPRVKRNADSDVLLRQLARIGRELEALNRVAQNAGNPALTADAPMADGADSELANRLRRALKEHAEALRWLVQRRESRRQSAEHERSYNLASEAPT